MRRYYLFYFAEGASGGEPMPTLNKALDVADSLPDHYGYFIIDRNTHGAVAHRQTDSVDLDTYQKILENVKDM